MPRTAVKLNNEEQSEFKEKTYSIIEVLDVIQTQRKPWNELDDNFKKTYSQFMINRFISSSEMYAPIIAQIAELKKLSDEQHYTILINTLQNRKCWFNYKSYKKEKTDKNTELLLFAIQKEYEIGRREARCYINKLSETVKGQLAKKWGDLYNSK